MERTIVKKHVAVGLDLVKNALGLNADVLAMIQHHHERHDGSGYPQGLTGADMPVFGRIAGLIDCFDAMTTKRPYAPAKSAYDAVRELNGLSGTGFQRELVEQFVQAVGMFPTGSLVELNTGEVAVVIEQNRVRRLRPEADAAAQCRQEARHAGTPCWTSRPSRPVATTTRRAGSSTVWSPGPLASIRRTTSGNTGRLFGHGAGPCRFRAFTHPVDCAAGSCWPAPCCSCPRPVARCGKLRPVLLQHPRCCPDFPPVTPAIASSPPNRKCGCWSTGPGPWPG